MHVGGMSAVVIVVGGAGFIGSHLVDRLLAEGQAVDVVDDLSTGRSPTSPARAVGRRRAADPPPRRGRARDRRRSSRCADPDVHLPPRPCSPRSASVDATLGRRSRRRSACSRRPAGTASARSSSPSRRRRSTAHPAARDLPVKEGALEPRGVRGVVAKAIVDLLAPTASSYGVEFTALGLSSVYGPRQRPDGGVVAAFAAAGGDGDAPHDHRRRPPDPRLRLRRRRRRRARARRAARERAGRQHRHRGADVGARPVGARSPAPTAPEPTSAPPAADELLRFAVSPVRARIHLAWSPWTDLEPGSRSAPLTPSTDRAGGERGRGEVGGDLGRRHHRRHDDGPHPGRLDRRRQVGVDGIDDERRRRSARRAGRRRRRTARGRAR